MVRAVPPVGLTGGERQRGVDQADVREGLREIAQHGAAVRVHLFGDESYVVSVAEQLLKGRRGARHLAAERQAFDRPEAADPEGALARRQAIVALSFVAVDEAAVAELLVDALAGAAHTGVGGRAIAVERQHEQARVKFLSAKALRVALQRVGEAPRLNRVANGRALAAELA